jgi:hypothetical protein
MLQPGPSFFCLALILKKDKWEASRAAMSLVVERLYSVDERIDYRVVGPYSRDLGSLSINAGPASRRQ